MSLPELCLRRPVATTTCALAALILGAVALVRLPVEYLPEIEGRSLTITASYPASSPQEVERTITKPLEEELASLEGLSSLDSTSSASSSTLRVELESSVDIDAASLEVRERIDRARTFLPEDVGRIEVRRWRSSDRPVLRCRVAPAPGTSQRALERYVDEVLVARLGRLPGVGNVEVQGLGRRRVLVEVDRDRLAQAGLTASDVASALRARNRNVSAGQLRSSGRVLSVRILGELGDAVAVGALPIGGGRLLGDVADVREEIEPLAQIKRLDGKKAITLRVSKESGANSVDVCLAANAELEAIRRESPGFRVEVFSDDSNRILTRLANLGVSAFYGGALLCGVLFLFLRELRSTAIVALTIPLSVVLTFGILFIARQLGVSTVTLNVVSMMGLILGIGLVVDTGIVVLENVFRLREEGVPPREAAARGATEVSGAITASMITSLIVFVPMLFSTDQGSAWTRDLAVVVCASVFSSLWVALTIVPLLAAAFLGGPRKAKRVGLVTRAYRWILGLTLKGRWLVLLIVLPLCGWQIFLFFTSVERSWGGGDSEREIDVKVVVPRAFTPSERSELFGQLEARILESKAELDLASLTTTFKASAEAEPQGRRRRWGGGGDELELVLNSDGPGERKSLGEVRARLRKLLPDVPGVLINLGASRRMGGGGRSVNVLVHGRNSGELLAPAQSLTTVLKAIDGVEEVELETAAQGSGLVLRPDRELSSRYGVSANEIGRAVSASLSERAVTRLRNRDREIEVILRLEERDREGVGDLMEALVPRSSAPSPNAEDLVTPLPVGSLVSVHKTPSPREIKRVDRNAVVSLVVSVAEGHEVRTITQQVERTLRAYSFPRGIGWKLDNRVRRWRSGESTNSSSAILAFVLVLMLLAALFESTIDALVIAITVPFALVGVAWAFWATNTKLDSMAWIGLMILIGIVVNHGIVLVDRMRRVQAEETDVNTILLRAGSDRMRPIVMTAATTVLGLLPIVGQHLFPEVFSGDSGAQVYGPIGLAVASGLVVSTALTLLVLPAALGAALDVRRLAKRLTGREAKA